MKKYLIIAYQVVRPWLCFKHNWVYGTIKCVQVRSCTKCSTKQQVVRYGSSVDLYWTNIVYLKDKDKAW